MKLNPLVECRNRTHWRQWLQREHARMQEVWLVFYKKHTGEQSISYREALEEALCFGWINGLKRRIDDARYAHRFTPRKVRSKWSPRNIELARRLIDQGLMTPAGLETFQNRVEYTEEFLSARDGGRGNLDPELESTLKSNPEAWKNFQALAPGYRRQYAGWINSAKRPETRLRRLEKAIIMLEENRKPGF